MADWYCECNKGIAVSSRVRLARNIEGYPFPSKMNNEQIAALCTKIQKVAANISVPEVGELKYIAMDNIPEIEVYAMVERHIISPDFANNRHGRGILLSSDERVAVMLCEEDHLRIQVISEGLALTATYKIANAVDDALSAELKFAFDNRLGYLTACPTNIGTGLRASVMLHLPMLAFSGMLSGSITDISKIGFTMRGLYGEGSDAGAQLYQLSNQITLGLREIDAIGNLEAMAEQFVAKEKAYRNENNLSVSDKIHRAFGILKYSQMLSTAEMMKLVSLIKLGTDMGILNINGNLPIKILIETGPYMLMRRFGECSAEERDVHRAEHIRNLLE